MRRIITIPRLAFIGSNLLQKLNSAEHHIQDTGSQKCDLITLTAMHRIITIPRLAFIGSNLLQKLNSAEHHIQDTGSQKCDLITLTVVQFLHLILLGAQRTAEKQCIG